MLVAFIILSDKGFILGSKLSINLKTMKKQTDIKTSININQIKTILCILLLLFFLCGCASVIENKNNNENDVQITDYEENYNHIDGIVWPLLHHDGCKREGKRHLEC